MVEHLTKDLGASRIAIMYQDDAFGLAGLAGVKKALDKRRCSSRGRTSSATRSPSRLPLLAIRKVAPHAVIMISPYKPAAEFIKSGQADQVLTPPL